MKYRIKIITYSNANGRVEYWAQKKCFIFWMYISYYSNELCFNNKFIKSQSSREKSLEIIDLNFKLCKSVKVKIKSIEFEYITINKN